ncbi:MAG: hypothetical protein ABIW94_12620 [Gemmatimonadaceae bacterium]
MAALSTGWWANTHIGWLGTPPPGAAQPGKVSDFDQVWQAATALINGGDPYVLMGPGLVFHLEDPVLYPVTAFVAAIPLVYVPEIWATMVFLFLSTFLMAYGITVDGWHRLPIFVSLSFITSVWLVQWSMLMTAALFLPWIAVFTSVKPQAALPIVAASESLATPIFAFAGTLCLLAISLVMMPGWPIEWFQLISSSPYVSAPITRLGGFIILLVLLRWRRPEAWLVLFFACIPQTPYPYNVLLLLALPNTWREAGVLSIVSSLGSLVRQRAHVHDLPSLHIMANMMVASAFIPATIMILRRPNEGKGPWWMQLIAAKRHRRPDQLTRVPKQGSAAGE